MRNAKLFLIGMLAGMLTFGMTGCDDVVSGAKKVAEVGSVVYAGKTANGEPMELIITNAAPLNVSANVSGQPVFAYTPKTGDTYVIKVSGLVVSSGSVKVTADAALEFSSEGFTFTATVSAGGLKLSGKITASLDGGSIPELILTVEGNKEKAIGLTLKGTKAGAAYAVRVYSPIEIEEEEVSFDAWTEATAEETLAAQGKAAAEGEEVLVSLTAPDESPVPGTGAFTQTGSFFVVVKTDETERYAAAGFLNGSAGIDLANMKQASNVTSTLNSSAIIQLPDGGGAITIDFASGQIPKITGATGGLNSAFEIYYRIYVSDVMAQTVNTTAIRNSVNPTLASDWSAFEPYTIEANNLTAGATIFTNRKYYPIEAPSGNLVRSNGGGAFTPKPDNRLFQMSVDLVNEANLNDNINRDVQNKTGMTGVERYAYASMYIIMRGFDETTLTPFYGAPTFINVFLLPSEVSGSGTTPTSSE